VNTSKKKKILVLSTYSCYPPRGGGQQRLFNIYSRLAKHFDVTICSIVESNKEIQNLKLYNGLIQICIPQSRDHAELQSIVEKDIGLCLHDICMINLIDKSPEYVSKAKKLIENSDIIVFSHPYLYRLSKFVNDHSLMIYEAHNVEYLLKKNYINDRLLVDGIRDIERKACFGVDMIWVTSKEDGYDLNELYNADQEKIFVVPNGVDTDKIPYSNREDRIQQKAELGLSKWKTVLFVGSWHPPNLEALEFISFDLAIKKEDYLFLVVGSVKDYYFTKYNNLPKNILCFGVVDDIAINPMFSGSGTNIKMLDYMSAGLPVISTQIGARGLEVDENKHAVIATQRDFAEKLNNLMDDDNLKNYLGLNARRIAENRFSWDKIVEKIEHDLL